jgi:hypothetical protein
MENSNQKKEKKKPEQLSLGVMCQSPRPPNLGRRRFSTLRMTEE